MPMSKRRVVAAVVAAIAPVVLAFVGYEACRKERDGATLEVSCDSASLVGPFQCTASEGIAGMPAREATAVRCAEQAVSLNGYTDARGARLVTTIDLLESADEPCRILLDRFGTLGRSAAVICDRAESLEVIFPLTRWGGRLGLSFFVADGGAVTVGHGEVQLDGLVDGDTRCNAVPTH